MGPRIKITLAGGAEQLFPRGLTGGELVKQLGVKGAEKVLALSVNGRVQDLHTRLEDDGAVELLCWPDPRAKEVFWHSTAHLLAEAVQSFYPDARLGMGPSTAQGFYYDIDFGPRPFTMEDLPRLEERVVWLAQRKLPYERVPIGKEAALEYYDAHPNPYKVELLEGLEDGGITFYRQGSFMDLCKGPHLPHTGHVQAVKLTNVSGAYWRGDERRPQLTRLYGISFPSKKELREYLFQLEEAKKRDHRKVGKSLHLFTFSEEVGVGLPLWLEKGTLLRETLVEFLQKAQRKGGYAGVVTPHIGHKNLYITSGHYQKYRGDAFQPIATPQEGEEYLLKPMNCPHHCEIYKVAPRSYKELPLRLAEFGTVYRYEQHGELHGLTRTRGFTQDDAHIFCRPDQVEEEFGKVIDLVGYILEQLEFKEYRAQLSLRDPARPERYIGSGEMWERAEEALRRVVERKAIKATTVLGEAAFYGPKLDFMVRDALHREWQLGTVQLDYNLPERFGLTYIDKGGESVRPVMIHRAPFGSLERLIALLLEHTAGCVPLWLAPVQVAVLPVGAHHVPYATSGVKVALEAASIRCAVDLRNEKIGRKVRDAALQKVPYALIVGEEESRLGTVAVRAHGVGPLPSLPLAAFIDQIKDAVKIPDRAPV